MSNKAKIIYSILIAIPILVLVYFVVTKDEEMIEGGGCGDTCSATNTPAVSETANGWKESRDASSSVSFMYPVNLGTNYISILDWPPRLQVLNQKYSCKVGGDVTKIGGKTDEVTIAGMKYCITRESEGAAGSIYTMYDFAFPVEEKTYVLTFSSREPQCANFDDPRKSECEVEEATFDINPIVTGIVQTMKKI